MFSVIFPGQGSQLIGMGKEIFDNYDLVKKLFKEADEVLGISLTKIIFDKFNLKTSSASLNKFFTMSYFSKKSFPIPTNCEPCPGKITENILKKPIYLSILLL